MGSRNGDAFRSLEVEKRPVFSLAELPGRDLRGSLVPACATREPNVFCIPLDVVIFLIYPILLGDFMWASSPEQFTAS